MNNGYSRIDLNSFVVNIRHPVGAGPYPVTILLHGWTGDESSMWLFVKDRIKNHFIFSPRAPYPSKNQLKGGYSWTLLHTDHWPEVDDFIFSAKELLSLIESLSKQYEGNFDVVNVVGFSQGAALGYVFSMIYPEKVRRLVALAGFLPDGSEKLLKHDQLQGLPILIEHGIKDDIVPIELARKAKGKLLKAGAEIDFIQLHGGHTVTKRGISKITGFIM